MIFITKDYKEKEKEQRKKSKFEIRQETHLGGASVDLSKILKGKNKPKRIKKLYQEIGISEKKTNKQRVLDERLDAIWKPINVPAKKVKSWSKSHKARQEANKKKAVEKYKGTGKKVGHNLKKGQADGDKGRKMGTEARKN